MSARKRALLSSDAEEDLQSIIQFTNQRWGPAQGKRYRHLLRNGFSHLARHPELGQRRPEIGDSIRARTIGAHLVVYLPIDRGVLILRIIHQHRDPESLKI